MHPFKNTYVPRIAWNKMIKIPSVCYMCVLSHFSCVRLFVTLWTVAHQASLCMEHCPFSRKEYWSGLAFPSSGDLPDPGIEPVSWSPALASELSTTPATWEAMIPAIMGLIH